VDSRRAWADRPAQRSGRAAHLGRRKRLDWRRDTIDLYAFHVTVPPGATELDVNFDVLMNATGDVMWRRHSIAIVELEPGAALSREHQLAPILLQTAIVLPDGWQYGTALRDPQRAAIASTSPLPASRCWSLAARMGRSSRSGICGKTAAAYVQLDAFADAPQDLDVPEDMVKAYERVPGEAFAMYGSRHFLDYHALLTLSDALGFQGIEHHQSSDDRADDGFLTDPTDALAGGDLVTHEFRTRGTESIAARTI